MNTGTFRIEHQSPEQLKELQLASAYLAATKTINRSAFPTFLFGIVDFVLLYRSPTHTPYDLGLFLNALGLIAVGIYMMRSPRPITMLINALLLWASSIWYIFWYGPLAFLGFIGIWQGGREFARWRRFQGHFRSPSDPIVRESQEIVNAIHHTIPAQSASALELYVAGDRWMAMVLGSVIAFLNPEQKLLLCAMGSLDLQEKGGTIVGGFRKVLIRVGTGKTLDATITPEYLERLHSWCAGMPRGLSISK